MDWTEYEELVFQECCRVFNDGVRKDVHIKGRYSERMRQIDIYILNANIDGEFVSIIVDAKHYGKKIDVKTVESYMSMMDDVGVRHGIIVSSKGFTSSAIKRAHKSPQELEVDILSIKELELFQSRECIVYSGKKGFAFATPFCWVADGRKKIGGIIASFYRNDFSTFQEAIENKEFIYVNLYYKDNLVKGIQDLLDKQKADYDSLLDTYELYVEQHRTGLVIRHFKCKSYPVPEVTAFREFEDCIIFGVLFTPEIMQNRDIKKLIYLLNSAILLNVQYEESAETAWKKRM